MEGLQCLLAFFTATGCFDDYPRQQLPRLDLGFAAMLQDRDGLDRRIGEAPPDLGLKLSLQTGMNSRVVSAELTGASGRGPAWPDSHSQA